MQQASNTHSTQAAIDATNRIHTLCSRIERLPRATARKSHARDPCEQLFACSACACDLRAAVAAGV
eukprot:9486838-Lingulodinium_polyedra.AAC.1